MNDPRLLDYALGELAAPEREAFERELAASTELQRELHETIALLEAIPSAIAMNETLTDSARETLRSRAAKNLASRRTHRTTRRVVLLAAAGALAAGFAVVSLIAPHQSGEPSLLKTNQRPMEGLVNAKDDPSSSTAADAAMTAQVAPVAPQSAVSAPPAAPAQLLAEAKGFQARGSLDLASKRYEQVLDGDSGHIAARQGLEEVAAAREQDYAGAYNETRSRLLSVTPQESEQPRSDFAGGTVAKLERTSTATRTTSGGASPASPAAAGMPARFNTDFHTEAYDSVPGNRFLATPGNPLSTFSIDVDTASYANVRRFLTAGQRPPAGAIRIEELVNYFPYDLPQPVGDAPFSVATDVSRAPWNEAYLLARIALKGREIATDQLPPSNLVFLIDVSGSMKDTNKLPLLKRSLAALVGKLSPRDRVAIVVYAGSSGLALPSTSGEDKPAILSAIDRLEAGGSTNGAQGITLAYETARKHFLEEGNNRVILCTDGDFNIGVTSQSDLVELIERERKSGVFLSVLGFGTGNMKDSTMEKLADKGNGNYAYIDTPSEGRKVLVEQMGATLFTIAKDVKIQVEFNPATVAGYRLIGYENRLLAKEDFNDDTKDAGEIGAGHTVTALYEIVPAGQPLPSDRRVDPLKYQQPEIEDPKSQIPNPSPDLFTVKLRFKPQDGDTSKLIEKIVSPEAVAFENAPEDFRFAAAVAAFGMKLRGGQDDAPMDWTAIQKIARGSLGEDPGSYRAEFLTLVEKARHLQPPAEE